MSDHLVNRKSFALITSGVARLEPVETQIGVIGALLLWKQDRKSLFFRQVRPTGAMIISCSVLRASV
jgi:hypothetical protein